MLHFSIAKVFGLFCGGIPTAQREDSDTLPVLACWQGHCTILTLFENNFCCCCSNANLETLFLSSREAGLKPCGLFLEE